MPAALERSRSGNGGHVWIFFDSLIQAVLARKLGSAILTYTLERHPQLGLDSYDRFFPSQNTMPKGGVGSLIALPLQKTPRGKENSIFLDRDFNPYSDQWAFLSGIRKIGFLLVTPLSKRFLRLTRFFMVDPNYRLNFAAARRLRLIPVSADSIASALWVSGVTRTTNLPL